MCVPKATASSPLPACRCPNGVSLAAVLSSRSQPCSETSPCYALLVNSLSLELGPSQLACCSRGVFQLKGAPWVLSLLDRTRSLTLSQERNSAKSRVAERFCLAADPCETCTTASPGVASFSICCWGLNKGPRIYARGMSEELLTRSEKTQRHCSTKTHPLSVALEEIGETFRGSSASLSLSQMHTSTPDGRGLEPEANSGRENRTLWWNTPASPDRLEEEKKSLPKTVRFLYGYPGIDSVNQAGLELRDLLAPACLSSGIEDVCYSYPAMISKL
ncbi:uncharacterized protein LOC132646804 [Meriones unguiculatus]|uniref:uncharacterized protein LOC132646804 n=1 Tax=Meriones unguiculatus TaxID=10047 RepID=UPI00293F6C91|nr:uncharacterized protein LOC132646804 [Meriones unguiculatus]